MELDATLHEIIELDQKYYLNCFGQRVPLCIDHGEGVWVFGTDGRRYLDMIGGIAVNVLGHAHPRLIAAISEQAAKVIHCSNYYYNEPQTRLAARLASLCGLDRVFIGNSGAEANEAAIKLARGYFHKKGQPRAHIVSALQSFHGRTLATATATGQPKYSAPFAPLPPGFVHVPFNDQAALRAAVTSDTCAVLLELIQGESGVRPADPAYVRLAGELCHQTGARLIVDEIQTGMGRTGYFLASQFYGLAPDIVTLAKGLAGGVPIGAVVANEDTASGFAPGDHGSTFGGNPLACAAALAVLDEYESAGLVQVAADRGEQLQAALRSLLPRLPQQIREVRGAGLMIGIELAKPCAAAVKNLMMDKGYLVGSVGESVIRLLPPLILPEDTIAPFAAALHDALKEATAV
jgi:acetylornithine/N-succinyldiaminopimelate aminotransferase